MKNSPNDPCPCGSGAKYKKCCRVYHMGTAAPSPEALMRSRYTAYALDKPDYIMQTTHPEGPHFSSNGQEWRKDIEAFSRNTRFVNLQILAADGETVTFRATLYQGIHDASFTERSLFRQYDGRWLYLSGDIEDASKG